MTAVHDDDSSDDESDCGPQSTRDNHVVGCEEDQQEELEVFAVPKAKSKITDSKSETSLANALAASIQMVESSGKAAAEAAKQSRRIGDAPQPSKVSPHPKTETTEGLSFFYFVEEAM